VVLERGTEDNGGGQLSRRGSVLAFLGEAAIQIIGD
jgi:hypothetical protein